MTNLSANGIWVNGVKVNKGSCRPLVPGDLVTLSNLRQLYSWTLALPGSLEVVGGGKMEEVVDGGGRVEEVLSGGGSVEEFIEVESGEINKEADLENVTHTSSGWTYASEIILTKSINKGSQNSKFGLFLNWP